jgi:hypothetical protein
VRWLQGAARALEGIPTSVNDEDAIAGWPVTAGSIKDNRAREHRRSTSCWRRAPCCTPRPNGTGVLFHSAGPGARPLGVTRNPWNLRITWANWPHLSSRAARPAERLIRQLKIVMLGRNRLLERVAYYFTDLHVPRVASPLTLKQINRESTLDADRRVQRSIFFAAR